MEDVRKALEDLLVTGKDVQTSVSQKVQEVAGSAAVGIAEMEAVATGKFEEAKGLLERVKEDYEHYEGIFFHHLNAGVRYAYSNPSFTAAAGVSVFLVSWKGSRRFLYNRVFGFLRSPESMVTSAEQRLESLKQSVDVYRNESLKLQERAAVAAQEFKGGREKLRATGAELDRLLAAVRRTSSQSQGLRDLLVELPAKDSIRLRSELGTLVHEAKTQRKLLEKELVRIARTGAV